MAVLIQPSHADLVQRAVRWLRGFHKCSHAYGEFVAAVPYIPDAIGWRNQFSILVECKRSRSDFFADRKKLIHHNPDAYPGEERWYLTPPGLVTADEVPEGWYLAEADEKRVRVITHPPTLPQVDRSAWPPEWRARYPEPDPRRTPDMWRRVHNHERAAAGIPFLLSALRRHELGVPFDEERGRFETMAERDERVAIETDLTDKEKDAWADLAWHYVIRKDDEGRHFTGATTGDLAMLLPGWDDTQTFEPDRTPKGFNAPLWTQAFYDANGCRPARTRAYALAGMALRWLVKQGRAEKVGEMDLYLPKESA